MSLQFISKKMSLSLPLAAIGITVLSLSAAAMASNSNDRLEDVTVEKITVRGNGMPMIVRPGDPLPGPRIFTTFSVRVSSGGCTDESSFKVEIAKKDEHGATVRFVRVEEDHCEAYLPNGTLIELTVPGRFGQIRVENPLMIDEQIAW